MQAGLWQWFDIVLAALLLGLGWAAVASAELRRAVVLFIAFGLLLAIVWARLSAPDLALAEAAIGAGLSGALLLAALRDEAGTEAAMTRGPVAWTTAVLSAALAVAVAWALLHAYDAGDGQRLADDVQAELKNSGVSNPVTAVLLNFRAYDTLLELAVLLAAVLGVLSATSARRAYQPAEPVFGALVVWLVPLLILTGGYVLWVGAHAPGGAFQAGALLAAAAIMLRLGGADSAVVSPAALRWLLVIGVGVFAIVGLLVTTTGRAFLEYPVHGAGMLILLIECSAALAIAATLTLAYVGGRPTAWQSTRPEPGPEQRRGQRDA